MKQIDSLIICNPYTEPSRHWLYDRTVRQFELRTGRRPAGFLTATPDSKSFDDPGEFREMELVNRIRPRVNEWRRSGYPGATGITKNLLWYWTRSGRREKRLFFCQLEAIETLIWLVEAPPAARQGIEIPSDGGGFARLCCKMATGTGKTIVMGMAVAWQAINRAIYPRDPRFSRNILVMAPGLTVKSRLRVLRPSDGNNIYDEFELVPDSLRDGLNRANIAIHNWHTLTPEEDAPRSVVKLGAESDSAFSKRILGHELDSIVVINDEAHHAYRADAASGMSKKDLERDRRWMEGLDRIHAARKILHCLDFTATPFVPSGKSVTEETLFGWIVSDFSLNDAIESGLTKTPRIAMRDDGGKYSKEYLSKFYHLYNDPEVKPDLNRNALPEEPLPDLVSEAYMLLGQDWTDTKRRWDEMGSPIPPVMITVCNKTQTAARVKLSFERNRFELDELSDPACLLHIDSAAMRRAEEQEEQGSEKKEEELRRKVDTVGRAGEAGGQVRNIVAVQMLSEGWDAHNVTHIMGLRAFTSQLLCEQVIGRGLRRTSYEVDPDTGLYMPEYVNVFGVPFTFLPHEGGSGTIAEPPSPTTTIMPDPEKIQHVMAWPNIDRIDVEYSPRLEVDWDAVAPITIQSTGISTTVGMTPILEGKPHVDKMSYIDLCELDRKIRLQHMIFLASRDVYAEMAPCWKGTREVLVAQIIRLVERFISLGKVVVIDVHNNELRTRMAMMFNLKRIVQHVCKNIGDSNTESRHIRLNGARPVVSTTDMRTWHTKKPTEHNTKSHINMTPCDSKWEMAAVQELERNPDVVSWVKNDHLGFVIPYLYNGITHEYWPDFLIRLANGITLVLEIKGADDEQNKTKRAYLERWIDAVNDDGGYGTWAWDVAFDPSEVVGKIEGHARTAASARVHARCPRCGAESSTGQDVERVFGFCDTGGITRPQSWCRACRSIRKGPD